MGTESRAVRGDRWFIVNLAVLIGTAVVIGIVLYLSDHLEWSWH